MFYNRRKVALFLPMYVIGGIIAFNLLKILLNVTEIKNYYTNHIIFLEISMVNSNPRIPFVTQDSPFVNESPVL